MEFHGGGTWATGFIHPMADENVLTESLLGGKVGSIVYARSGEQYQVVVFSEVSAWKVD